MENTVEKQYPEKWQKRFAFYKEFGGPSTQAYHAECKKLSFSQRILIRGNIIAFFFGPIYFFVIGLWRKNLAILGIAIVANLIIALIEYMVGATLPEQMNTPIGFIFSAIWACTANYAYYLKETQNSKSWNPFEGIF
ncbi:DUF2628 domain-containing protein [Pectobacterium sp. B1J-3]|uniref:DUF2628 domain-containing protein n=1 Tax=Pectobacterium sp. B1J-3 TaxID=3385371 RepID=UPI0039058B52